MKREKSCGLVPVWRHGGQWKYLLVQHRSGHWGFPKGHVEVGESEVATAEREVTEEVGLTGLAVRETPRYTENYVFTFRGVTIDKHVVYFLARVHDARIRRRHGEIIDAHWFDYRTAKAVLGQLSSGRVLEKAHHDVMTRQVWN